MVLRHESKERRLPRDVSQRDDAEALARGSGLHLAFAHEGPPVSPANRTGGVTLTGDDFATRLCDLRA